MVYLAERLRTTWAPGIKGKVVPASHGGASHSQVGACFVSINVAEITRELAGVFLLEHSSLVQ